MKIPSNTRDVTLRDLIFLCQNMRPDEMEQLRAYYPEDELEDVDRIAAAFYHRPGPRMTVLDPDGIPAVCGGWTMVSPGVWEAWMVGTMSGWRTSWRSITKTSRWMMAMLAQTQGARRFEMSAIGTRPGACQWYIDGLGMVQEGVRRARGRNGEDIHDFGVVVGDLKWAV